MRRPLILVVMGLACAFTARTAAANDFQIQISVQSEDHEKRTEHTEEAPSLGRKQPRPVLEIRRNAPVVMAWHAVNTGKTETFEDVLVHFFVVEEKTIGQAEVPKLSAGVVYEGALTMDFKPRDKADWRMSFKIPEAGNYLVRVETIGMAAKHGHEHFAVMDLLVR